MKILVTGGSGRIGGYALRELKAHGHALWSLGRMPPLVEGVHHVPGNILKLDALKVALSGMDAVLHLSVGYPGRTTTEQLMLTNIMGTFNVLEAAALEGVGKVVFASSEAAFGFAYPRHAVTPRYFPVDEDHPCEPQDEYGLSKLIGEVMCRRYSQVYGIKTICIRICSAWYVDRVGAEMSIRSGPLWNSPITLDQLWTLYREQIEHPEGPFPVPGPASPKHRLWSVTDARDSAQGCRLALENDSILHDIFLTCADDTCSLEETASLIARYYPNVPLRTPLEGYASLFSHAKATRLLGYSPKYTWRTSDFAVWLTSRHQDISNQEN